MTETDKSVERLSEFIRAHPTATQGAFALLDIYDLVPRGETDKLRTQLARANDAIRALIICADAVTDDDGNVRPHARGAIALANQILADDIDKT